MRANGTHSFSRNELLTKLRKDGETRFGLKGLPLLEHIAIQAASLTHLDVGDAQRLQRASAEQLQQVLASLPSLPMP